MAQKTDQLDPQVVELLLKNTKDPKDLFGDTGILHQLKAALCSRVLDGELTTHLGYEKHEVSGNNSGNSRNGHRNKTLQSSEGNFTVKMPRDRSGDFEPQLISKEQHRFEDLDHKIISLYSRGIIVWTRPTFIEASTEPK